MEDVSQTQKLRGRVCCCAWGMAMVVVLLLTGAGGCSSPSYREQLQSEDPIRRINGAVASGESQDRSASALLVDRLEDQDEAVRMYAILALQRIEGTTLGYKYWAAPPKRAHMAQQWRTYLKTHRTEKIVQEESR